MRKFIGVSFAFLFLSNLVFAQQGRNYDVLHYRFDLKLSDETDRIFGNALIKLRVGSDSDQLELELTSEHAGRGMTVTKVGDEHGELSFKHNSNKIIISTKANAGDTVTLSISYNGIPADGLIIDRNKYGHRTFFADNWPNRGHNWIPCNDIPADKSPVEFIVTAPQHYQVVANGIQIEETNLANDLKRTHYREDAPVATKIMVIGVADFAVGLAGMVDCIPVYSWVYPEDRDKGFYDYALATEILSYFIKNIGPYGYKKLANVESKTVFGGLENAGTIFYSEKSITGTRSEEDLLAHEIAHQWFGDMVTEKTFAHLWLSEGFAVYFEALYFENKYGKDTVMYMRRNDRQAVIDFSKTDKTPIVYEDVADYMDLLTVNNYQKAGWVLHMLRQEVGDSIFWKSVRSYYSIYAGRNADTDHLKNIFEKESGKNLDVFFKQWLYTPGQPKLAISWTIDKNKKLAITVKQLQSTPFVFPLEIGILSDGQNRVERLKISRSEETFLIANPGTVTSVIADPDVNLLCEQKIRKGN